MSFEPLGLLKIMKPSGQTSGGIDGQLVAYASDEQYLLAVV